MASLFPAYTVQEFKRTSVQEYTPGTSTDVFVPGSFVFYDTTSNTMKLCAADPALIAGISEVDSVKNALITPNGKVPVRLLHEGAIIAMSSATTPADSHVGDKYGITKASGGQWQLDTAKTGGSARVIVVSVDIGQGIFYCQVLTANLQFAGA